MRKFQKSLVSDRFDYVIRMQIIWVYLFIFTGALAQCSSSFFSRSEAFSESAPGTTGVTTDDDRNDMRCSPRCLLLPRQTLGRSLRRNGFAIVAEDPYRPCGYHISRLPGFFHLCVHCEAVRQAVVWERSSDSARPPTPPLLCVCFFCWRAGLMRHHFWLMSK